MEVLHDSMLREDIDWSIRGADMQQMIVELKKAFPDTKMRYF